MSKTVLQGFENVQNSSNANANDLLGKVPAQKQNMFVKKTVALSDSLTLTKQEYRKLFGTMYQYEHRAVVSHQRIFQEESMTFL